MVDERMLMQGEIRQKQREAEERVRRMREENRRLAQGEPPPTPTVCVPPARESGRWLPLLLALVILREGGPMPLVLALVYLSL